jgi:hypothetical protein
MAHYKVGKKARYSAYLLETLRLMWDADVTHFAVTDVAEWSGLPNTTSMREWLDALVLSGWLSVEPAELRPRAHPRIYSLSSVVWYVPTK